jgi:hypothetical protein
MKSLDFLLALTIASANNGGIHAYFILSYMKHISAGKMGIKKAKVHIKYTL